MGNREERKGGREQRRGKREQKREEEEEEREKGEGERMVCELQTTKVKSGGESTVEKKNGAGRAAGMIGRER